MFLKPDYNLKSIYDINLDELQKDGVKAVLAQLWLLNQHVILMKLIVG